MQVFFLRAPLVSSYFKSRMEILRSGSEVVQKGVGSGSIAPAETLDERCTVLLDMLFDCCIMEMKYT